MFPKMKSKIQVPSQLWKWESIFFPFSIFHHQKIKSIGHRDWSRHKHKHKQNKKKQSTHTKTHGLGQPSKVHWTRLLCRQKAKNSYTKIPKPSKVEWRSIGSNHRQRKKNLKYPSLSMTQKSSSHSQARHFFAITLFLFFDGTQLPCLFVCLFGYFSLCCYFIYVVVMCIWESIYNSPASAYSFWEIPIKFILFYFC